MKQRNVLLTVIKNIIVWIISLVMMVPLLLILINSLKDRHQASSMGMDLPKKLHFENYLVVIEQGKLIRSFFNSMFYASAAIVIAIILTSMAAYVLSRNKTRFNRFIYFFIIMGLAMPVNFVSLMKIMQITRLNNTQIGIVLLYAAIEVPVSVFLIYGFIGAIPLELDEAGILDGCGPLKLYFKIIMPLLKPVLVTVAILTFMDAWNQFTFPLYYLNSASKWPMTLAVYNFFGQFYKEWNLVSADIILTSLPVLIIYLLGQKYIISGMTAGSVKA
ncbi:MAG: carbohydrate ABC transporter permease [Bacillota bacterium]